MRIVLVDDELLVRDLLRRACRDAFGHEVVGEAGEGGSAVPLVRATRPDLIVLDLQLGDRDGLDVLDDLRREFPAQRVLILSHRCDPYTVYRVSRAGACGFVDKEGHSLDMLGRALVAIEKGTTYFSPAFIALRLARHRDPQAFDKLLSEREQNVLIWICRNLSDGEIAERLSISPQTVEKHRFNMLRKLTLPSTAALVRYARAQGFAIVEPPG